MAILEENDMEKENLDKNSSPVRKYSKESNESPNKSQEGPKYSLNETYMLPDDKSSFWPIF